MRRIQATLPTLGNVSVDFFAESDELLQFLGTREIRRLRRVPHLGVAASVFTGVNHSRLEYMLLQCAVIGLVAKLPKHGHFGFVLFASPATSATECGGCRTW